MKPVSYALATAASLVLAMLQACGPNCQSTCTRLYQTGGENCNIQRAGRTRDELNATCMRECRDALATPGDLGDYDPYNRRATSQDVALETDRQAALWMDCVSDQACDNLEGGYCAPVW